MQPPPNSGRRGFTRIELVAVLATLTLVTALAAPALAQSARHSRTAVCLSNLMRLATAWSLFAADHDDRLPDNGTRVVGDTDWCGGSWLSPNQPFDPNNWDHDRFTRKAQLWPYLNDTTVFTCPEDPSRTRPPIGPDAQRRVPVLRSYAMNSWIGGPGWPESGPGWQTFSNTAQIAAASPGALWVLMDERAESINDGFFVVDMRGFPDRPQQSRWVDFPGYLHNLGAGWVAADGHAETHQWRDRRTVPAPSATGFILDVPSPNNADVRWLQERTTRRAP